MRTAKLPKPWRHQREAERALTDARKSDKNSGLMVMATGLGKNYTAALAFDRFRRSMLRQGKQSRVLFLAHQSHMLDQARETFEKFFGRRLSYGTFSGTVKEVNADAVFATFQSADSALFGSARGKRRLFGRKRFDYVIVDESHHSHAHTYRRVIRYFKSQFMVGMTATPDRTDLQDIREIYGNEVYSLPLEEGLAKGLLAPVDYRLVTDGLNDLNILNTPVGKLSVKRLNKTLFIPRRDKEIARIILRHAKRIQNPRVMIFCPSIRYCDRLVRHLPNAVAIHSLLPVKEQAEGLAQFRAGKYDIVLTVDKFNEGIDIPEANMIVFLRSTASRLIFFQQLGRGLRKVRGKKNVLVLDFAANCERLQMVNKLWTAVTKIKRPGAGRTKESAVSVDIGKVQFSHVAKRILDVLGRIHEGYTREVLISQLKRLKRKLGRVPTAGDINNASKRRECASPSMFSKVFGSIQSAQRAAGMRPRVDYGPSPETLIKQLKALARRLRRVPMTDDIHRASRERRCASVSTFANTFGSFAASLEAAGMTPNRVRNRSKADIIRDLKQLHRELGRVPIAADLTRARERGIFVSPHLLAQRFGSQSKALRAAGLQPVREHYTRASLIKQLKGLRRSLGHAPTVDDIVKASKQRKCAGVATFAKWFGSIPAAHAAAGMRPYVLRYSQEDLINQLKRLKRKLGRTPTVKDVDTASRKRLCANVSTFAKKFGSYRKALAKAKLESVRRYDYTKKEIIADLRRLQRKLRREPTCADVSRASKDGECVNMGAITLLFGSFLEAKRAAGIGSPILDTSPASLKRQLRRLKRKLGHVPTGYDIVAASKRRECASDKTFIRVFGSVPAALQAVGMKSSFKRYTKSELVAQLRRLELALGHPPTRRDIIAAKRSEYASPSSFAHAFGSLTNARRAAQKKTAVKRADRRKKK